MLTKTSTSMNHLDGKNIQAQNFTTESVISEKALFDVHGHCLPQVQVYQSGNECNTARSILDHYVPEVARRYSPLVVLADGNCFFRAASRTLFGTEQYHCALRLSCADEVAQHLPFYDENSEPAKLAAIDGQNLLTEISTLGGWQTIASAFALSGVLGIPLQTFYPEVCHREMPRLSRSVYGRNVRRQKTAQHCIMFSACAFNGQDFNFDHYVPLVERQEEDVMEVVDLSRKQHYVSTKNTTNINSEMHVGTANYQETMLPSFVDDPIGLGLLEEEEEIRNLTVPQPEVSTKISSSQTHDHSYKSVQKTAVKKKRCIDGTFKVVKKPFMQLLTINVFLQNDRQVPTIFVLMSSRDKNDYLAVFQEVLTLLEGRECVRKMMMDFEPALWAAAQETTHAIIKGCSFHHRQAIWRKIQSIPDLLNGYTIEETTQQWCKEVMALSALPVSAIPAAFRTLSQEAVGDRRKEELVAYMATTWMPRIADWSVYEEETRTNNALEGWHHRLNQKARWRKPGLYELIEILRTESVTTDIEENLAHRAIVKRRNKYTLLNKRLKGATEIYKATKDWRRLLRFAAHSINN